MKHAFCLAASIERLKTPEQTQQDDETPLLYYRLQNGRNSNNNMDEIFHESDDQPENKMTGHDKILLGLMIGVVVMMVITFTFNGLSGQGAPPLYLNSTGTISAKYETGITPAGSGPTLENPVPKIFPHKVYALSQLSDAVEEGFSTTEDKENADPNFDDEHSEPINFCSGDMLQIHISVHLHDYVGQYGSSRLSRQWHSKCQTKPAPTGISVQTEQTGAILTTGETQTRNPETDEFGIQVNRPCLTVEDMETDEDFAFYIGLPTKGVFRVLFESIEEVKIKQYNIKVKCGRPEKLRMNFSWYS
ncbi:hypothetical protein LOTGIDRAFT_176270 [Lottia gigantea]|uniref:Uncharacterized protein n=1 Tax=Lottia gigantea TaxID=225164 RepID=V3ZQ62_LOTGI|nr:hypothetical protein LOTGIDRAFT_176270 [Lottia gigantea]ESO83016.1 hypothetical protein LOTGIDRAFT_176270 [Lottia gigantea]